MDGIMPDDRPLGKWPEELAYKGEPGCLFMIIGFILFLAVLLVLKYFFFN
jgi:hypothetical protein